MTLRLQRKLRWLRAACSRAPARSLRIRRSLGRAPARQPRAQPLQQVLAQVPDREPVAAREVRDRAGLEVKAQALAGVENRGRIDLERREPGGEHGLGEAGREAAGD